MWKKTVLVVLLLIQILALIAVPVSATGEAAETAPTQISETEEQLPVIVDVEGLRLKLVQHTQNPYDKSIKFDVVVLSQINSDRVQISWRVSGPGELLSAKSEDFKVSAGGTKTLSATLRPRGLGIIIIKATVEAFQVDGTYISTASKTFGSYSDGTAYPITNEFRTAQFVFYLQIFATWAAIIVGIGIVVIIIYRRWSKWVGRDRIEEDYQL